MGDTYTKPLQLCLALDEARQEGYQRYQQTDLFLHIHLAHPAEQWPHSIALDVYQ